MRAYYSEKVSKFLSTSEHEILGQLLMNHCFPNDLEQKRAWAEQIHILKQNLVVFLMQLYFSNFQSLEWVKELIIFCCLMELYTY